MAEKCSSCEQMKKENSVLRKAISDTDRNYVEVINENLAMKRRLEKYESEFGVKWLA